MADALQSSDLPPIATLSPLPDSSPLRPTYVGCGGWDEDSDSELEDEDDELHSSPPRPALVNQRSTRTESAGTGGRKRAPSPSASLSDRQAKRRSRDALSEFRASGELPARESSAVLPESDSSSSPRSSSPTFQFSSIAGSESDATSLGAVGSASDEEEELVVDALSRYDEKEPHKLAFPYPLQSALSSDPWLVVLASGIIESIQGEAAVAVYSDVASRWHTPSDLLSEDFPLQDLLRILCHHIQAVDLPVRYLVRIRKLAADFKKEPVNLERLTETTYTPAWLTSYIRDSLRIFCVSDDWRNVKPTDPHLIAHLKAKWAMEGKLWHPEKGVVGARHAVIPIAALPAGSRLSAHITLPL